MSAARWLAIALGLTLWLLAAELRAHDFSPGVLALIEREPGRFDVAWTAPVDSVGAPAGIDVVFPPACAREGRYLVCGREGLRGPLRFAGMHQGRTQIVVSIEWRDGRRVDRLVTGDAPSLKLDESQKPELLPWLALGVEHILLGLDHVAFVLGLLLVVRRADRRLLATITAFTLAHSITLALAALDLVHVPAAPVEATIAASVVLVAREATHEEPTLTRRFPWAAAGLFGLVHGMGFASVLRERGLPSSSAGWALASFNVGVELGQLALVGLVLAVMRLSRSQLLRVTWARAACCYALGGLACCWLIERTVALVMG